MNADDQYDLVVRLREYYTEGEHLFEEKHPICDEAANEIERLREEIAKPRGLVNSTELCNAPASFSALQSVDRPLLARAIYESLELSNPMAFMGEFSLDGTVTVDSRFNFQAVATFLLIRVNDLAAQAYAPLERTLGSEISSEMVDAGVQVLRESGFLWRESSADHLLVQRLLKTALSCRSGA